MDLLGMNIIRAVEICKEQGRPYRIVQYESDKTLEHFDQWRVVRQREYPDYIELVACKFQVGVQQTSEM